MFQNERMVSDCLAAVKTGTHRLRFGKNNMADMPSNTRVADCVCKLSMISTLFAIKFG